MKVIDHSVAPHAEAHSSVRSGNAHAGLPCARWRRGDTRGPVHGGRRWGSGVVRQLPSLHGRVQRGRSSKPVAAPALSAFVAAVACPGPAASDRRSHPGRSWRRCVVVTFPAATGAAHARAQPIRRRPAVHPDARRADRRVGRCAGRPERGAAAHQAARADRPDPRVHLAQPGRRRPEPGRDRRGAPHLPALPARAVSAGRAHRRRVGPPAPAGAARISARRSAAPTVFRRASFASSARQCTRTKALCAHQ